MTHYPMKRDLARATAALGFLTAAFLPASTTIPILNPRFNLDTLPCSPGGNCNSYGVTGWVTGPQTYVLKASTAQFPSAPVTGLYIAAIGTGTSSGSIMQTVGATVQANTTYILSVEVGA